MIHSDAIQAKRPANRLSALILLAGLTAGSAAFAQTQAPAQTMSRDDYQTVSQQISQTYKTDKQACDAMSGNGKDVCVEEAKGKEKIARAELDYRRSGKDTDRRNIAMVKADSAYQVAKERCDDQKGEQKDACVKDAKAMREHAVSDAKLSKASN